MYIYTHICMYRMCYTSLVAHMIVSHMLIVRHKHIECDSGQTCVYIYTCVCTYICKYGTRYGTTKFLRTAMHCNALQHAATHCNTLQRTATHMCERSHALRTATHCNKHICERARALRVIHLCVLQLQHIATHCDTLRHTATHCNTL